MYKKHIPPKEEMTLTKLALMIQDGFSKMLEVLDLNNRMRKLEELMNAKEKK